VFAEHEAAALLPLSFPYGVPVFTRVKVHRDFHVEVGRAWPSLVAAQTDQPGSGPDSGRPAPGIAVAKLVIAG
jgi:hypothetical protein